MLSQPVRSAVASSIVRPRINRPAAQRRGGARLALLCAALLVAACKSNEDPRENGVRAAPDLIELSDRPVELADDRAPGAILADFDGQIRRWNEFALSNRAEDQRKRRRLEDFLRVMARKHLELLDQELSSPNSRHRAIAASAIGFSGELGLSGALVAALEDDVTEVVDNALLGLGQLADPATPVAPLVQLLGSGADGWTRSNAAFALKRIVEAGGAQDLNVREDLRESLKLALLDREDAVRVQAAATLQTTAVRADLPALVDALYDPAALVVVASAMAVRRVGEEEDGARGEAARALYDAWQEREERNVRTVVKAELARLAGRNFGDDEEQWREWAYGLP
jgi:HEAT repeat protein